MVDLDIKAAESYLVIDYISYKGWFYYESYLDYRL